MPLPVLYFVDSCGSLRHLTRVENTLTKIAFFRDSEEKKKGMSNSEDTIIAVVDF